MNNLLNPSEKKIMRGNKRATNTVVGSLNSVIDVTQSNTTINEKPKPTSDCPKGSRI